MGLVFSNSNFFTKKVLREEYLFANSALPGANDKHALGGLDDRHLALPDGLRPPEVVVDDGLQGQLPVGRGHAPEVDPHGRLRRVDR